MYMRDGSHPDSALMVFTLLVASHEQNSDADDVSLAIDDYNGLCYTYFFHYYDYPSANEILQKSIEGQRQMSVAEATQNRRYTVHEERQVGHTAQHGAEAFEF